MRQLKANIREKLRALGPEILRKILGKALDKADKFEAKYWHQKLKELKIPF